MPTFEVIGPDPDGDWFVERIQQLGTVTNRIVLMEAYPGEGEAKDAANRFNADPENAATA